MGGSKGNFKHYGSYRAVEPFDPPMQNTINLPHSTGNAYGDILQYSMVECENVGTKLWHI